MAKDSEAETLLDSIIGKDESNLDTNDDNTPDDNSDDRSNQDREEPRRDPANQDEQDDDDDDNGEDQEQDEPENEPEDELEAAAREANRREPEDRRDAHQQSPGAQDPFNPRNKITTDKAGNVFVSGKLIAKSGREARMFMGFRKHAQKEQAAAFKLTQHMNQMALGAKELYARYDELKRQGSAFKDANITPEEQQQVLQLALAYKKSPIEGIKLLLTRAHLAGVDIKALGVGGGLDPKVLLEDMKGHMTELLKPVTTQTSDRAKQDAIRQEAEGFYDRNPMALDVANLVGGSRKLGLILKEAKAQSPNLTLDELFQRLHYAILVENGGKLPTGPVGKTDRRTRRHERRMGRNLSRSVTADTSYEDIGKSVLADIQAAESRGQ